ncbi:hypothetical protein GCM10023322_64520 [Rugosimonospora acidiphila]|uniref:Uncharacterized protein n=1 Tax=Rugosimonospora acidiphila TaxID=556531 RepID=A0ABP9SJ68_9ACTN
MTYPNPRAAELRPPDPLAPARECWAARKCWAARRAVPGCYARSTEDTAMGEVLPSTWLDESRASMAK